MKVIIVGVGNMGSAIIKGLLNAHEDQVCGVNPPNPRVSDFARKCHFPLYETAEEAVSQKPDVLIFTTPAAITTQVLADFHGLSRKTVIISAAAGVTLNELAAVRPHNPLAAIIPNTPVAVNSGTIGLATATDLPATADDDIHHVLDQLGNIITVPEDQLDIIGVVGGCGPAFVDVFMDAMSDAAVKHGLGRQTAYQLIASMVKGSGTLASESQQTPAQLRDQVTSPGGTTIRGVEALEKDGLRFAVMDAINRASK